MTLHNPDRRTQETQVRGCRLCHIIEISMSAADPASPLLDNLKHQDEVFISAFSILQAAINERAFPVASVAVTYRGTLVARKALGHFTYEASSGEPKAGAPFLASLARSGRGAVTPSTLFDLASLTKVVATTPMAMLLYERGLLDLDTPVSAIVPEFTQDAKKDPRRHEVTLRQLLAHSSSHKSRNPRPIQRHRIHPPRYRSGTSGRRISRPFLPARNLRPTSHAQHHLQSPTGNPRTNPSNPR